MNCAGMKYFLIFTFLFLFSNGARISPKLKNPELLKQFWLENAKKLVRDKLSEKLNTNKAKNVILFLGDGMGLTTIAATRVVMGGEEKKLSFENFPHTATAKTYCLDESVPDSACASNAFLRGFKANYGNLIIK